MNLQAIAAIAEITASAGVIISLIYVGLQIRSQIVESRLASVDELTRQINSGYQTLASDKDLAELFLKGLDDFKSLDRAEIVRFSAFMGSQMRQCESAFFRYTSGRLAKEVWTGLNAGIEDISTSPGMKDWWQTRSHWFSKGFRDHISNHLDNDDKPRMYGGE